MYIIILIILSCNKLNDKYKNEGKLFEAIRRGRKDLVELYIKNVDINYEESNCSPLFLASKLGYIEIAELLIKKGANINSTSVENNINSIDNYNRFTPLTIAVKNNYKKLVKLLIKNNASLEVENEEYTPLISAIIDENVEMAKFLISKGANVNYNRCYHTPLTLASYKNNVELAELLIKNGADVNQENFEGYVPLAIAASCNKIEILSFLIKNGADINKITSRGRNPLMEAAEERCLEALEILLIKGADTNVKNHINLTSLDITKNNFCLENQSFFVTFQKYIEDKVEKEFNNFNLNSLIKVAKFFEDDLYFEKLINNWIKKMINYYNNLETYNLSNLELASNRLKNPDILNNKNLKKSYLILLSSIIGYMNLSIGKIDDLSHEQKELFNYVSTGIDVIEKLPSEIVQIIYNKF